MGIFSKKRSDGKPVKGGDPMNHIMPYVMRGRNESAIYFSKSYDIEPIQRYIRERRIEGKRITAFNIIVAAILQTIYQRPHLNRFVAGRRLYEHNSFDVLYVVKKLLTDDGLESVCKVNLNPHDTLDSIADTMTKHIEDIREGILKTDDKLIHFVSHLPRFSLRIAVWFVRLLDFYGLMPKSLMEAIPFYSSIFISHLGSIGASAPFHHLYEFGTTSIFMTIGRTYYAPYRNREGDLEWRKTIDLKFTIDERICDGFYMIKSLKLFDEYMQNPYLLDKSPVENDLKIKKKNRDRKKSRASDMDV